MAPRPQTALVGMRKGTPAPCTCVCEGARKKCALRDAEGPTRLASRALGRRFDHSLDSRAHLGFQPLGKALDLMRRAQMLGRVADHVGFGFTMHDEFASGND